MNKFEVVCDAGHGHQLRQLLLFFECTPLTYVLFSTHTPRFFVTYSSFPCILKMLQSALKGCASYFLAPLFVVMCMCAT